MMEVSKKDYILLAKAFRDHYNKMGVTSIGKDIESRVIAALQEDNYRFRIDKWESFLEKSAA